MLQALEEANPLAKAPEIGVWPKGITYSVLGEAWAEAGKLRTKTLQDAIDAIRAACEPCGGTGYEPRTVYDENGDAWPAHSEECEYCGRPIAAIKGLPGAPK
jgi:hypothetical protein